MPALDHSAAEFLSSVRQLIESRNFVQAEDLLRERIFSDPLDAVSFGLLAEVRALSGRMESSRVADKRFRQLQQIAANSKPAHAAECYRSLCAFSENPNDSIELNGFCFAGLRRHESDGYVCAIGPSLDGRAFLKIDVRPPSDGSRGHSEEIEILQLLSDSGCQSSANVLATGAVSSADIRFLTDQEDWKREQNLSVGSQSFPYVVLTYTRADQGGFGMADIALALLEQQALGVYQNCLTLPNIRFDSLYGVCRFSDYRNAVLLEESVRELPPNDFLEWCKEQEVERCSVDGKLSFLEGRSREIEQLYEGDQFLLVRTQLFGRQLLADVPVSSVQEVSIPPFKLSGSVTLEDRYALLDRITFEPPERVLDLGCGAGGISRYLARRGCTVTGVDCDARSVIQANLLANIGGKKINHLECDLEFGLPGGHFDTVLALAVLPHVSRRVDCAKRIAATECKRIIIECMTEELGFRWQGSLFHPVDGNWDFENKDALSTYLEELFPDFKLVKEIGVTASNRSLFILEREDAMVS